MHNLTYQQQRFQNKLNGTSVKKVNTDKGLPFLLKIAENIFNRWVRERGKGKGCITCGSNQDLEAGHFIPVGENSALRFHEFNCHQQCHVCNCLKRGNRKVYRDIMIEMYGLPMVLELESTPKFHKWSRPELLQIIEKYKIKLFNQ